MERERSECARAAVRAARGTSGSSGRLFSPSLSDFLRAAEWA
jgi:hypothetical protein